MSSRQARFSVPIIKTKASSVGAENDVDAQGELLHKPQLTEIGAMVVLYLTLIVGDNKLSTSIPNAPEIEARVLGVALTLSLAVAANNSRFRFSSNSWIYLSVLWIGYLLLSTRWAPLNVSNYRSATSELLWLAALLLLIALVLGIAQPGSQIYLWWTAYAVGVVFALAGLAAGAGSQGRFSAFGGGPNTFVRVVFIGIIAAVVVAVKLDRPRYLLPVPILIVAVLLSGSRGGLIAGGFASVVIIVAMRRNIGLKSVLAFLAAGGLLTSLLTLNATVGSAVRELFTQRIVSEALEEGDLSGRAGLYSGAVRVFLDSPLFGVGAGGFAQVQTALAVDSHAHNLALSTLAEGGLIGGLILALALFACWRAIRTGSEVGILYVGALAGALFILVAAQFSGYYFDFRLFFLFVAMASAVPSTPPNADAVKHETK